MSIEELTQKDILVVEKNTIIRDGIAPDIEWGFFGGPNGKKFLDQYNNIAQEFSGAGKLLKVYSHNEKTGVIEGGNIYSAVLLNEELKNRGLRIATFYDISVILQEGMFPLGNLESIDIGVVTRTLIPQKQPNYKLELKNWDAVKLGIKGLYNLITRNSSKIDVDSRKLKKTSPRRYLGDTLIKLSDFSNISSIKASEDKDPHNPLELVINHESSRIELVERNLFSYLIDRCPDDPVRIIKSGLHGTFRLRIRRELQTKEEAFQKISKKVEEENRELQNKNKILNQDFRDGSEDYEGFIASQQKQRKNINMRFQESLELKTRSSSNNPDIIPWICLDSSSQNLWCSGIRNRTIIVKEIPKITLKEIPKN